MLPELGDGRVVVACELPLHAEHPYAVDGNGEEDQEEEERGCGKKISHDDETSRKKEVE